MATTGDWRDRWEERDSNGCAVLDVWVRDDRAIAYLARLDFGTVVVMVNTASLIHKPQPPRPKQYRPYTEQELWDVIQKAGGVLWVKEKDKKRWISVDRTENAGFLFKHYTHLNGEPFGMEVGE